MLQGPAHIEPTRWAEAVCATLTGFFLSGITLVVMPKCPVCVAAYATILTGISVSTGVAGHLRLGLMVACTSVLVFLTLNGLTRAIKNPAQKTPPRRP